jgi:multidrug efflux pump subunit AcrA (membrane-fusion protein)
VVETGRALKRAVRIGQNHGQQAEVLDGLKPDERVGVCPSDEVRGGVCAR